MDIVAQLNARLCGSTGTRLAAQRMRSDLTDYPRVARLRLCNRSYVVIGEPWPLVLQYTGQTRPPGFTYADKQS